MINYHGQIVVLILFLVVIGIFLFGYVSYSNVSKELRDVTGDVRSAFNSELEDIYRLKYIDKFDEGSWDSICSATEHCCFILDNFDFKTLFKSNRKVSKAEFDNIEKAVKDYFHELNDFLSNADFDNLTTEQRNYLAVVENQISISRDNHGNFFPTLYEFIKEHTFSAS